MKDKKQALSQDLAFSPSSSTMVSKTISDPSALCDTEIKKFLYPDRSEINNALPHNSPPLNPTELDTELVPIAWASSPASPSLATTPLTAKEHDLQEKINTLTYLLQQRIKLCDKLQKDLAFKNRIMKQMNNNALGQELQFNELRSQLKAYQTGHVHVPCQAEINQLNDLLKEQKEVLEQRCKQIEKLQKLVYQLQTELKAELCKKKPKLKVVPKKEAATWTTLEWNHDGHLPCCGYSKNQEKQLLEEDSIFAEKLPLASLDTLVDVASSIDVGIQVEESLISVAEKKTISSASNLLPKAMYTHIEVTAIFSFIYLILIYASVESAKNHASNHAESKPLLINNDSGSISIFSQSNNQPSQFQRVQVVHSPEYVKQDHVTSHNEKEEKKDSKVHEPVQTVNLSTSAAAETQIESKDESASYSQQETLGLFNLTNMNANESQHPHGPSPSLVSSEPIEVVLESNLVLPAPLSMVNENEITTIDATLLSSNLASNNVKPSVQENRASVLPETNKVSSLTLVESSAVTSPLVKMESHAVLKNHTSEPLAENTTDSQAYSSILPSPLVPLDNSLRNQVCLKSCKDHEVQIAIQVSLKETKVMEKEAHVKMGSRGASVNETEDTNHGQLANLSKVATEIELPPPSLIYGTHSLERPSTTLSVDNPVSTSITPQTLLDPSIGPIPTEALLTQYHVKELLQALNEISESRSNPWDFDLVVKKNEESDVSNALDVVKQDSKPSVTSATSCDRAILGHKNNINSKSAVLNEQPNSLESEKSTTPSALNNRMSDKMCVKDSDVLVSNQVIIAMPKTDEIPSKMAMDAQRPSVSQVNALVMKSSSTSNDVKKSDVIKANEILPCTVDNSENTSSASMCFVDDFNPGIQLSSNSTKKLTLLSPRLDQEPTSYQYLLYRLRFPSKQSQRQNDMCKAKQQQRKRWIQSFDKFKNLTNTTLDTALNLKSISIHYLSSNLNTWTSLFTPSKSHDQVSKDLASDETLSSPFDLFNPMSQIKVTTQGLEEKKLFELGSSSVVNLHEGHDKSNYVTPSPSFSSLSSKCLESVTPRKSDENLSTSSEGESHIYGHHLNETNSDSTFSSSRNQDTLEPHSGFLETRNETTIPNDLHSAPAGLSATKLASIFYTEIKKGTSTYLTHKMEQCTSYLPTPVKHTLNHYLTPLVPAFLTKPTSASHPSSSSSSFSTATVINPPSPSATTSPYPTQSSVFSNSHSVAPVTRPSSASSSYLNSKTSVHDPSKSNLYPSSKPSDVKSFSKAPSQKSSHSAPIPTSPCTCSTPSSSSSPSTKKSFISGLIQTAITLPFDVRQNGLLKTAKNVLF